MSELKKKDPDGTNKKIDVGDLAHKSSFTADLNHGRLDGLFSPMFSHRFHYTQSPGLFYALYGSRYSYIGTASWCQKKSTTFASNYSRITIKTDLDLVTWDPLSYAGGLPRTVAPSYDAVQYLHSEHGYQYNYTYLKWKETDKWEQTTFSSYFTRSRTTTRIRK